MSGSGSSSSRPRPSPSPSPTPDPAPPQPPPSPAPTLPIPHLSPAQTPPVFTDTETHWARDAIAFSTSRGLTNGMSPNEFQPEGTTSRAMVFTLLSRLEGKTIPMAEDHWYDYIVSWAVSEGLTDGSRPEDPVTREELVTLLWRWSGKPEGGSLSGFSDPWAVSSYARPAVSWAAGHKILLGRTDASIDPGTSCTRAETAVILQRFVNYLLSRQSD